MTQDIYRRLQEQLDQYSLGFPATDSGIELEILRGMFTESEATMFTELSAQLEPPDSVAARLKRPVKEVADQLEGMAQKGLLFRKRQDDIVHYSAVPFIHGLLEFQVNRLDRGLVSRVGQYIKEKLKDEMARNTKSFLRPVPVQRSVAVKHHVAAYEDAREILKDAELIVVTDCACRRQSALLGKGCEKPVEVCFMFGPMGQYYIDNGLGRKVDLDEALGILNKAQEAGLVTQPASARRPFTMCSCCSDCCGFLRAISKHPRPADLVLSNYAAVVSPEKCSGCETCVGRCQMRAVSMTEAGISKIHADRCIGCGLCVTTCPEEAMALIPKSQAERREPPRDTKEQMTRLAQERGFTGQDPLRIVSFGF